MKKLFLNIIFICLVSQVYAHTTSDAASSLQIQYPLGGYSVSEGITTFHPDFYAHGCTKPTQAEIDALAANYTSLPSVRARKLVEIKNQD